MAKIASGIDVAEAGGEARSYLPVRGYRRCSRGGLQDEYSRRERWQEVMSGRDEWA